MDGLGELFVWWAFWGWWFGCRVVLCVTGVARLRLLGHGGCGFTAHRIEDASS